MTVFSASVQLSQASVCIAKAGREAQHKGGEEMTRHDHV
jgi:hypothetical protein